MPDKTSKKHDKLVRDGIPALIVSRGGTPVFHVADTEEYRRRLIEKLFEELDEFRSDRSVEEFADLSEVMAAVAEEFGFSPELVTSVREAKAAERGRFRERIVLDEA